MTDHSIHLVDNAVLQRDPHTGAAAGAVRGKCPSTLSGAATITVSRSHAPLIGWDRRGTCRIEEGEWIADLTGLPAGGPYTIEIEAGGQIAAAVHDVLVGDIWVLAGQSNMEGCGDLIGTEPPSPFVHLLDMARRWQVAEEPLHWLVDSPDPCHCELTGEEQRAASIEQRRVRTKGAGLGLPFANELVRRTGIPIGLVAAAHGGTSMQQWSPELRGEGGKSLYGSMLLQLAAAGGRARGVLWYQGESDANPADAPLFSDRFRALVSAFRSDFRDPELPFYSVQIGRVVAPADWGLGGSPWNSVQDQQRRLALEIPNTGAAPAVDLEMDDLIHIGVEGLKRLGVRLARIAEHAVTGGVPVTGPQLESISVEGANRDQLRVRFRGVSAAGFPLSRRITGFSLHDAAGAPLAAITRAAVLPDSPSDVLLSLAMPAPEGSELWYGWGTDPAATLADLDDMAVPVFGPQPVPAAVV